MDIRKPVFCGLIFIFTAGQAAAQSFQFAAIGDTGYSKKSEQEFSRMIAAMNREPLAFVVHVGDFEADPRPYMRNPTTVSEPCTDESFRSVLAQFQTSEHPLVLTPGDNDWTDCHLLNTRKVDPLERLTKVRELFIRMGKVWVNGPCRSRLRQAIRNFQSFARTSPGP